MKANRDGLEAKQRHEDSRVAWFVVLERARERGDAREAEQAVAQLKRLGLRLSYTKGGQP